jgi:hypothetical protein
VNEGVNFTPRGQILPLGAKFTPRGELHPWGPGVKLRMALCAVYEKGGLQKVIKIFVPLILFFLFSLNFWTKANSLSR